MMEFTNSLIDDKAISRKVYILEQLDNGQNLVPSKYLAEQLQCSTRTISNDIAQLKHYIPNNWEIVSVKIKGYILMKPTTDCIFSLVNSYLTESITYKIMIGIFNNKYYSLEKWS
ncbi:helix-turn-helix domain-containing protein [Bacillus thuringiensis]|uniref:helix-turn-helix domain-containing protein n=1 Tax=Bacillus thuringiensis TaxID=1428 RepID=UPI00211D7CC6|nr:helix-turn-helix domain-containing protein [Bacillus thuringiensis]